MLKWACSLLIALPLAARAEAPAKVSTKAPAQAAATVSSIRLQDFDGHPVAFSTLQRDATLLAVWNSKCETCVAQMPLLEALYKKLAGDPHFAVLAISLESDDSVPETRKFLATHKVAYPILHDDHWELISKWHPDTLEGLSEPTIFVFDRQFHAVYLENFTPGITADEFVAYWSAQLENARAGKLHKHMQRLVLPKPTAADIARVAPIIEKIVRSQTPERSDVERKKRLDTAMKQYHSTGTISQ